MLLQLNDVYLMLTGDAEKEVWQKIAGQIPANTQFFKVPHHGSVNGSLDAKGKPLWISQCARAKLCISSHIKSKDQIFPDQEVLTMLEQNGKLPGQGYFRTDRHYHITFETDGQDTTVRYWH
jgi:beta-lactamase superfamily II metal-dependent hydrolase